VDASGEFDDEQLLALAVAGDRRAFSGIYERHKGQVLGAALRLLGDWHDAEDATAAVFLEAWRRREDVRFVEGSARPWLLVTTMNVARNLRRARYRYDQLLRTLPADIEAGDQDGIDEGMDRAARRGATWVAFSALAKGEQEALLLCTVEGLSLLEAAKVLGVAVGTVKSRLSRGKAHLAERIERDGEGIPSRLAAGTLGGGSRA